MEIKIPYGERTLSCEVADKRVLGRLLTKQHEMNSELPEKETIRKALEMPIGSPTLRELSKGKNKVVIVTSDHTRSVPSHLTLPLMLDEIRAGSTGADITVLIAVGSHRATTHEEMIRKFGPEFVEKEKIVVHDPHDKQRLINLGKLPSGGDLILNRMAVEADLLVADGFIEPHVFAGFSGGRKSILPGIASFVTVMANHNAEFTAHPNTRAGVLEANPIHEDMLYAARTIGLDFILNVIINGEKKVVAAFAGGMDKAHLEGCSFIDSWAGVDAIPAPIVITSNGGYPADQDIYQAIKSVMAAAVTCPAGGVIIASAECRNGHGSESFYKTFAEADSVEAVLKVILARKRNETVPDQWVNQFLGQILMKNKVIMVSEPSNQVLIENLKMTYAPTLQEALSLAEEYVGQPDAGITIIPDGVSIIVRQK